MTRASFWVIADMPMQAQAKQIACITKRNIVHSPRAYSMPSVEQSRVLGGLTFARARQAFLLSFFLRGPALLLCFRDALARLGAKYALGSGGPAHTLFPVGRRAPGSARRFVDYFVFAAQYVSCLLQPGDFFVDCREYVFICHDYQLTPDIHLLGRNLWEKSYLTNDVDCRTPAELPASAYLYASMRNAESSACAANPGRSYDGSALRSL